MKPQIIITTLAIALGISLSAQAQKPRTGNQYLTVGFAFSPGVFSAPAPPPPPWNTASPAFGTMVSLGIQAILAPSFTMGAEVELGNQWISYHTANISGQAQPETAFAWQFNVIGRWLPFEDGLTLGAGIDYYRAQLSDSPLQQLGFALRAGTYLWRGDEFALIELGYSLPFISGLSLPSAIVGDEIPEVAGQDWALHRFRLSIVWGF